ncbi:MAG: Hsp33 family molecular chaperone HslO [Lysobacterales bacterium]
MKRAERDGLHRFAMHGLAVRGAFVSLDDTWQAIRLRNLAPPPAEQLLGEAVAATALMASRIKVDGRVTLQLQGDTRLKLLMAECTSTGTHRGVLSVNPELSNDWSLEATSPGSVLTITIENARQERYQGIVEITGNTLADALTGYFTHSEQLDTRLWLSANNDRAAGLIVQRLPERSAEDPDGWNRITHLAATVTAEELLGLSAGALADRLFAEEELNWEPRKALSFDCPCSRQRVAEVLTALGDEALRDDIEGGEIVTVDCEFCNEQYTFDAVDLRMLVSQND